MMQKHVKNKVGITLFLLGLSFLLSKKIYAQSDTIVAIYTDFGVMKVKLYDDTPIHKRNFLKLASQGFYDSLLFHRVINGFMIQGGDPDSKKAETNANLGNGDIGYKLPPEIVSSHIHKKGALAAARQSDDVNPEKLSSGCQFYIVHGKKFSELDMVTVESRMTNQAKQNLTLKFLQKPENTAFKERYLYFQKTKNSDSLSQLNKQIHSLIENDIKNIKTHKFTTNEKLAYSTQGGAPHLDGNYTVFGEVIEGIEVIDKIAEAEISGNARPLKDIKMVMKLELVKK
ncbi:MAG TPA: peptidylprolyl isomerase [Bacteroidia bacterium]|nr:peptidylprolyl isomerase [Bacteroidia bacterium]